MARKACIHQAHRFGLCADTGRFRLGRGGGGIVEMGPLALPLVEPGNSAPAHARRHRPCGRPPPLENSRKCARCSLLPICLPDEVNLFRSGGPPRTPPPAAEAALPLHVQQPGARVGKKGDLIVVSVENQPDRCRCPPRRSTPWCAKRFRSPGCPAVSGSSRPPAPAAREAPMRAKPNTRRAETPSADCCSRAI